MNFKKLLVATAASLSAIIASSQTCYEASILSPSPFLGNNGEIFKLSDGSLWEVKFEYEYLYEYLPDVLICPSRGKLLIRGKNLNVQRISGPSSRSGASTASGTDVIEARIDGEFQGWEGETIFKLTNGQIWQQASYAYTYTYKFMPKVMIIKTGRGYELHVDGMDRRILVQRIR